MNFGERVAKIRKQKGWTQLQLSENGKISVSQIKRYESGHTAPSLELIKKLAITLDISTDELIFDEGEIPNGNGLDKGLMEKIKQLSKLNKKEKESVIMLLDSVIFKHQVNKMANQTDKS